jgi:hypothetical protein
VKTVYCSIQSRSLGISESLGRAATALRRAEAWESESTTEVGSEACPDESRPNPVTTTVPEGGIETAEFELSWTTKIASPTIIANAKTVDMKYLHDR